MNEEYIISIYESIIYDLLNEEEEDETIQKEEESSYLDLLENDIDIIEESTNLEINKIMHDFKKETLKLNKEYRKHCRNKEYKECKKICQQIVKICDKTTNKLKSLDFNVTTTVISWILWITKLAIMFAAPLGIFKIAQKVSKVGSALHTGFEAAAVSSFYTSLYLGFEDLQNKMAGLDKQLLDIDTKTNNPRYWNICYEIAIGKIEKFKKSTLVCEKVIDGKIKEKKINIFIPIHYIMYRDIFIFKYINYYNNP